MTETTGHAAAGPRAIYRDPGEGMFAGVCAAVGRYTDTDPVIWRIVTVVLTIFGGAGAALYLLAWLLIPKVGEDRSIADSWINRGHTLSGKALVVLGLLALILISSIGDSRGAAAVAVLAVVGYLVYRERHGLPTASYAASPAPAGEATAVWTPPPAPVAPVAPVARGPRGPRSRLGGITLSIAAVVTGALVLARLAGADGLTASRIVAGALLVVGAGLVVGTWYGRARWLAVVGLVLCVALAGTAAAERSGLTLTGGVGQRTWPASATQSHQDFELGIGEATLDLTRLPSNGAHLAVTAHVSLGHLIVLVPNGVPIRLHTEARAGQIVENGTKLVGGADTVQRVLVYGPPSGGPSVEVDASVGTGEVEVRRG